VKTLSVFTIGVRRKKRNKKIMPPSKKKSSSKRNFNQLIQELLSTYQDQQDNLSQLSVKYNFLLNAMERMLFDVQKNVEYSLLALKISKTINKVKHNKINQINQLNSFSHVSIPKIGTLIPNRIFVGGLTSNTTEDELKIFFSSYGPIKYANIINDRTGLSKRSYGFVTFENEEIAEKLTKNESETLIFKERKLNIKQAERNIYILDKKFLEQFHIMGQFHMLCKMDQLYVRFLCNIIQL
jgi:RNA recognition motif-containing protein